MLCVSIYFDKRYNYFLCGANSFLFGNASSLCRKKVDYLFFKKEINRFVSTKNNRKTMYYLNRLSGALLLSYFKSESIEALIPMKKFQELR